MLINKQESAGLKNLNYSKAFIEYSNDMDDIYKKYRRIRSKQGMQNIDHFWWYGCWYT